MKLEVENITKKYKDKTAVDNVSITFTPGVWGLLGANGAGKTTLMRMIAEIMEPTEGKSCMTECQSRRCGESTVGFSAICHRSLAFTRNSTCRIIWNIWRR